MNRMLQNIRKLHCCLMKTVLLHPCLSQYVQIIQPPVKAVPANVPLIRRFADHGSNEYGFEGKASFAYMKCSVCNPTRLIIDVRDPKEIEEGGCIPSCVNIPLDCLQQALMMAPNEFKNKYKVDKPDIVKTQIICYSNKGRRSKEALDIVRQLGYKVTLHYPGGYKDWSFKFAHKLDNL